MARNPTPKEVRAALAAQKTDPPVALDTPEEIGGSVVPLHPVEPVKSQAETSPTEGAALTHPLLIELDATIRRFFILTPAQRLVIALWIVHTYLAAQAAQTPYLAVTSPEPRCGKTSLLELLEDLSYKGWYVFEPSEAVVFRTIDRDSPTFILDEYDAIFGPKTAEHHEGVRAILNAGNRPGAKVPRCIAGGAALQDYAVYCPKALGGIGRLPATVQDRSVIILMKRKKPGEAVERFRRKRVKEAAAEVKPQIVEWANANRADLAGAEPEMPPELNDRMMDACECLVAIADAMGDGQAARAAISELVAEAPEAHETMRLKLLRDIRTAWITQKWQGVNMPTRLILTELQKHKEWSNYYDRGVLKDTDLASLLAYFDCKADSVWIPARAYTTEDGQPNAGRSERGYKYEELHDAWERYLEAYVEEAEEPHADLF